MSCQSKQCKEGNCILIIEQQIDMYSLIKYTPLVDFYYLFSLIISASPLDSHGYLTLTNADVVIKTTEIQSFNSYEFWIAAVALLNRRNHKIYLKRERDRKRYGGHTR